MNVERHPVTDRASWLAMRQQDVTASAVGALLGVHEYVTPYALWAEKTGRLASDEGETGPMRRGRLLERVAIDMLREDRPAWQIKPGAHYYRDPAARLGATPDVLVVDPERGPGIVQVKSVEPGVFRRKWRDEAGELELPLWIAVQVITEAHLTEAKWAAVAALVVDFDVELHLIDAPIHAGVIERVREAVDGFWRLIESGATPDPDYGRDGSLIEQLFREGDGEEIDLSTDNMLPGLLDERKRLSDEKSAAEKRLKEIKAEILFKLGLATAGRVSDGRLITAKTVNRKAYTAAATSFRDVRVRGEAA